MAKVRKAVIAAAGRGTRQYPASSAVTKEMFPLVDRDGLTKPVIQIIGEEAIASGIEEICIITQPGGEAQFRNYFRRLNQPQSGSASGRLAPSGQGESKLTVAGGFSDKPWAMAASEQLGAFGDRLRFAEQASPEGFGHAVYQARRFVGDEPFLLLLGDHVYISARAERCARQLMDVFEQHDLDAATSVQPTMEKDLHLFGTIRGEAVEHSDRLYRACKIVEKPDIETARRELVTPGLAAGNYLCHFGMHVFSPAIFDSLEFLIKNNSREKGEFQLTAAQEHLRQHGRGYGAVVIAGQRYDTGVPSGLIETEIALALNGVHRAEICQAIVKILATQVK